MKHTKFLFGKSFTIKLITTKMKLNISGSAGMRLTLFSKAYVIYNLHLGLALIMQLKNMDNCSFKEILKRTSIRELTLS